MADEAPPWTIKNIAPEDRNAAIAAAAREHTTIGAWMSRAIRNQVQVEAQVSRQPAVIEPPAPPAPVAPPPAADIGELRELVNLAGQVSEGGVMPAPMARLAHSIIRARLRAIKRIEHERQHPAG